MRKSQVRWKGHVLFIFTIHINSLLNSQNTLWRVITNCIFIWTITGLITYIFDEPFTRFPHFSAFLVTPWSRALLEKLTSSQLVKKFPTFYGTQKSLPYSQVPVTCPYPESDQSWPCPPSHFLKIHLNINPPIYSWVFQVVSFHHVPPPKPCIRHFYPPYALHSLSIIIIRRRRKRKRWRNLNIVLNDKQNIYPLFHFKESPERYIYIYIKIIHLTQLLSHFEFFVLCTVTNTL